MAARVVADRHRFAPEVAMSRRGKRQPARRLLAWLMALALILTVAAWTIPATPVGAQAATPAATGAAAGAPAATSGTPGTPTPTATATLTPTPTATLTELQARLALARTFLEGRDFDSAANLYAEIIEDTRGNPEALEGLRAALDGRAAIMATQMAPIPTEAPEPTATPEAATTLTSETRSKVLDVLATLLAALLLIGLLYLLAALLRWVLTALRELWYTRILPALGRRAVLPGFLIGQFGSLTGANESAVKLVPIALTEKLVAWKRLVHDKETTLELAPDLDLGAMSWLKIVWSWLLPRPRGYRVTGALLTSATGRHQLAVQRVNLSSNSVEHSRIFESPLPAPEEAYRDLAGEAAKWLMFPGDIEADPAVAEAKGFMDATTAPNTASAVFDQALEELLPVRQQVNQGLIDFADARSRLRRAEALVVELPSNSHLRTELTRVIADLRKAVPGG
jgi:hypothetical protein